MSARTRMFVGGIITLALLVAVAESNWECDMNLKRCVCTSDQCEMDANILIDEYICTKNADECVVNCEEWQSCKSKTFYMSADKVSINCNTEESCHESTIECGIPSKTPTGFPISLFDAKMQECIVNVNGKNAMKDAQIKCYHSIDTCSVIVNSDSNNEIVLESTIFDCILSEDGVCEMEGCNNGKCVDNTFNCKSDDCSCFDCDNDDDDSSNNNGITISSHAKIKKPSPWSRLIDIHRYKTPNKKNGRSLLDLNETDFAELDATTEGPSSTHDNASTTNTYAFETTSETTKTSKVEIVKDRIINVRSDYLTTFSLIEYIVIAISVMLCGGTCLIFITVCYCHRLKNADIAEYSHHEIKNHTLTKNNSNSKFDDTAGANDNDTKKKTRKSKKKKKKTNGAHAKQDSTIVKLKSQVYHHSTQSLNDSETDDDDQEDDQGEQHHKKVKTAGKKNRRKNRASKSQSSFSRNQSHQTSSNKSMDIPPPPPLPPRPPVRLNEYQQKMVSARQQGVRASRSQRDMRVHSNDKKHRGNRRHKQNKTYNAEFGPNPGSSISYVGGSMSLNHQSNNTMGAVMVPQHHHHIYYVSPDNVGNIPPAPYDNAPYPGAAPEAHPHQSGMSYSYSIVAGGPPGGAPGTPQHPHGLQHEMPSGYNAFYGQAHPSQRHLGMQVHPHMGNVPNQHQHMMTGGGGNVHVQSVQTMQQNVNSQRQIKEVRVLETPHYNDNNDKNQQNVGNNKNKNKNGNNKVIKKKKNKERGEKKTKKRNDTDMTTPTMTTPTVTTPTIEFGKRNMSWKNSRGVVSLHVPATSTQVTATTLTSVTTSAMSSSCATPTSDTDATSAVTPTSPGSQTATSMYTETHAGDDDDDDDDDDDCDDETSIGDDDDTQSRKTTDVTDSTYMRSKKQSTVDSENPPSPKKNKKYKPRPMPIDTSMVNVEYLNRASVTTAASSSASVSTIATVTTIRNGGKESEHHSEASAALHSILNDIISNPKTSIGSDGTAEMNGNNGNDKNLKEIKIKTKNGNSKKLKIVNNSDNVSENTKSSLSPKKYLVHQNSNLSADLFSPSASHTPVPETFYPGSSKDSKESKLTNKYK